MNELERALISNSAAAPPAHILEDLGQELVHLKTPGAPRTIYEGIETPYPEHAAEGFPTMRDIANENWDQLRNRFFTSLIKAAEATRDTAKLQNIIHCPSAPSSPVRTMTVREQLESLTAHNAYHFGRIVLLRQLHHAWPPASGGDSW